MYVPGLKDERLQLGMVYERDDLAEHDQVIAGQVRLLQCALERRGGADEDRAAGEACLEGHILEHRRTGRAAPVSEPAGEVVLPGGQHIDGERAGTVDQTGGAAGPVQAYEHEERVQGNRGEGVDRHAVHDAVAAGHGDDCDSGGERGHSPAEGGHADSLGGPGGPGLSGAGHGGGSAGRPPARSLSNIAMPIQWAADAA